MTPETEATQQGTSNWPHALVRALNDSWQFVVFLRSGLSVKFETAEYVSADWVRLLRPSGGAVEQFGHYGETGRGIEVRVSDIMLAIDLGH